jgi:large subunit ribosomal protein L1
MPKPIPSQAEPGPLVKNLRNTIKIRSKDRMTFHAPVGTRDMSLEDIVDNIETVLGRIERQLEKGRMNIKSVYVKTTMGPAVRII